VVFGGDWPVVTQAAVRRWWQLDELTRDLNSQVHKLWRERSLVLARRRGPEQSIEGCPRNAHGRRTRDHRYRRDRHRHQCGCDMQSRLVGKRISGWFFREHSEHHGTHFTVCSAQTWR
jgi:hypothetical protein